MKFRKVAAIFPGIDLEKVENALIDIGVPGMTVCKAHGMGEYRNYYAKDSMADCVRVEIFTEADKTNEVVDTIARTVRSGMSSDGIVAVLPVEKLLQIRNFIEE